jgi:hypothetical protein
MLSVTNKPYVLNVVMPSVVILNVVALKAAASFCRQVAAWASDMFSQLLFSKNCIIAKNSTIIKATEI